MEVCLFDIHKGNIKDCMSVKFAVKAMFVAVVFVVLAGKRAPSQQINPLLLKLTMWL